MTFRHPISRYDLTIRRKDRVLEVGSGNRPMLRSNVLVERFLDDNYHRAGNVVVYSHQQLIEGDGQALPFADKEFDYVICNQVLEHAEDPAKFIGELTRVARRGYIETPSLLGEFLAPKHSHKWVVLEIDDKLIFYEKANVPGGYQNDYGELFLNYLPFQSLPFKTLCLTEGKIMNNRIEWEDGVDLLVNPKDDYYASFFTSKWTREMAEKIFPPRSLARELRQTAKGFYHVFKIKVQMECQQHRYAPLSVDEYIAKTHYAIPHSLSVTEDALPAGQQRADAEAFSHGKTPTK